MYKVSFHPVRHSELRISAFLDDYFLCASMSEQAEHQTAMLTAHLESLGFNINLKKSFLTPSKTIEYLCLALFRRNNLISYRTCLCLLGMMASAIYMIPFALLRIREFQRGLHACNYLTSRRFHWNVWQLSAVGRTQSPWGRAYPWELSMRDAF